MVRESSCGRINLSIAVPAAPIDAGNTNTNVEPHRAASALLVIADAPNLLKREQPEQIGEAWNRLRDQRPERRRRGHAVRRPDGDHHVDVGIRDPQLELIANVGFGVGHDLANDSMPGRRRARGHGVHGREVGLVGHLRDREHGNVDDGRLHSSIIG